jgi:hypothetical protein
VLAVGAGLDGKLRLGRQPVVVLVAVRVVFLLQSFLRLSLRRR